MQLVFEVRMSMQVPPHMVGNYLDERLIYHYDIHRKMDREFNEHSFDMKVNLRTTVMMLLSFAAVVCSGTAMKGQGAHHSRGIAATDDSTYHSWRQKNVLLLSALHHAVSCGWEHILNAVTDPACKAGLLGKALKKFSRMHVISTEAGKAAVHTILPKWGIAGQKQSEDSLRRTRQVCLISGCSGEKRTYLQVILRNE
jgi:hypothetical protein